MVRSAACESSVRPGSWARRGRSREAAQAHPRAGHPQAARGRRMLGEGRSIAEVCKALEVSEPTYHRWRNQYGRMKVDDAKRLRELERENARFEAGGRRSGVAGAGAQGD